MAKNPTSTYGTSLGLVCSNFLSLYEQNGVETIVLTDACARLGVNRRRLYEIINILESIGLVTKKAVNQYSWKGFRVIPQILQLLKEEGRKESYTSLKDNVFLKKDERSKEGSVSKRSRSAPYKSGNQKKKSLGLLTQNFVKLFLCSNLEMVTLDEAAKILLGDVHDSSVIQTKLKRLYDIANVLSSLNLIEKTYDPETRKPAFKWVGMRGEPHTATINDTKKRTFETELTNTSIRRRLAAPSNNATTDETIVTPSQTRIERGTAKKVVDESKLGKRSTLDVHNYQFGPSAPINVPPAKAKGNNIGTEIHDWESLSITHRPQYQNHGVRDLFGHFMGAWNFFYSQVSGKNPI